jgi:hypothetical protein
MSDLYSTKNEITDTISQKIGFFEYLYVFVLIIYGGRAILYVENLSFVTNPIGAVIPVILTFILVIKWKVVFKKQFYQLIFFYFIYFIFICTKYGDFRPTIFLSYFVTFFVVYSAVKALKFNLISIYEKVLYYLAIIGLFMWGVQTIMGGDTLYNSLSRISSNVTFSNVTGYGVNAILYSVQPSSYSFLYQHVFPRNCGYAWEPGGFAVYLCLAIFFNLFINNSESNSKKRFWVLLSALISTQSTSGYVIFIVIILFHLFNKKLHILIFLFPVIITALILLSSLPFMRTKIVSEFNQGNEMDVIVANSIKDEVGYAPGRALSFRVAYINFQNNPLFGLGTHETESWTYKLGAKISQVSGIGYILAQFGSVGFIVLIFFSLKSSFFYSKHFRYNGGILFFLVIILISISYILILLPLVMSFWMFSFIDDSISPVDEKVNKLDTIDREKIEY